MKVKELVSKLVAGEYGKWKPAPSQRGVCSESIKNIKKELLAKMRPPLDCTFYQLSAFIRRDRFTGNFDEFVCECPMVFSLKSKANCSYTLLFSTQEFRYRISISMPSAGIPGELILSSSRDLPNELRSKLFALFSLSDYLVEGNGFVLESEISQGIEIVSLRDP